MEYNMDIVQLMEELWKCFMTMDSFETDPDSPQQILSEPDSYALKKSIDRGLKWLVDKILAAHLDPIIVTLDDPGESNDEIVDALTDERSATSIEGLTKSFEDESTQKVYLTPHFKKHFDFTNAVDRHYLKNKVRFMSIQLGFHARPASNIINGGKQIVPFRCWVGSANWKNIRDKKKRQHAAVNGGVKPSNSKINYDEIKYCPFTVFYVRDIEPDSGKPLSRFRLTRYNLVHTHPLSMDYERVVFDN